MRPRLALALGLTLGLAWMTQLGCARYGPGNPYHRVTGTCRGACDHYLSCKGERGAPVSDQSRRVCELECTEVFSGREALMAFEHLRCDDAISFVEGDSGRGPGTLLSDGPGRPLGAQSPPP